ncbi:membrane cofactor protein-like [Erinaceus europaeus]|uniref:Membrane cofactor protein-like n=1 Tax=Erinaceus europaeus TaxID=9365 RepID=A0ABM3WF45_ERIEU|nr:membrane cofactor protein-like [Erinaceus europaeus]
MPALCRPLSPTAAGPLVLAVPVVLSLLLPRPADACGEPSHYNTMKIKGKLKPHYEPGERVYFECQQGYNHIVNFTLTIVCQANNSWTSIREACMKKACTYPSIENGEVLGSSRIFWLDDEASFFCDEGYHLVGAQVLLCKLNGNNAIWSESLPQCKKTYCAPPPKIKNGKYSPDHKDIFEYNEVVTYSCGSSNESDEFSLVGKSRLVCTKTGQWSSVPPECRVIRCEYPVIENGRHVSIGRHLYYQAVVVFECLEGFNINGSNTVLCGVNSTWEPALPECVKERPAVLHTGTTPATTSPAPVHPEVQCAYPVVENGRPTTPVEEAYDYRTTLQIECYEGSTLIGHSTISCGADGTWEPALPACVKALINPKTEEVAPDRVSPPGMVFPEASPAAVPAVSVAPARPVVKCEYPIVENGRPVTPVEKYYDYAATVRFECYEGFYLSGQSAASCGVDGSWVPGLPSCLRVPVAPNAKAMTGTASESAPPPAPLPPASPPSPPLPPAPGPPTAGAPRPTEKPQAPTSPPQLGAGFIAVVILAVVAGVLLLTVCLFNILQGVK